MIFNPVNKRSVKFLFAVVLKGLIKNIYTWRLDAKARNKGNEYKEKNRF